MTLAPVPHDVAHAGLRAVKSVCALSGGIVPLETSFLDGVQRHLLGTSFDIDALEPIAPEELARLVPPGDFRERVVGGMVIASCIDGETSPEEMALIGKFADALGVDGGVLRTGGFLADKHLVLARIDIARRALPGFKAGQVLREEGLPALVKQVLPMLGVGNDETAARYRALEGSPAGTLGRGYWEFITTNQFSFPGEKHAGPEVIVLHDLIHVLGGYGTTPEEEVQVAAFQAGAHHANQFHGMLFALAQFHLGISIAPVSTPETMRADPELMVKALARGSKVPIDMWAAFRWWDHFPRPLDDVRRELRIEPR